LNKNKPIKLLGHGKLTKNLIIQVNKASKSAIKSIQKVGGKVELI
jgi:large subunit ribosomal protein L15